MFHNREFSIRHKLWLKFGMGVGGHSKQNAQSIRKELEKNDKIALEKGIQITRNVPYCNNKKISNTFNVIKPLKNSNGSAIIHIHGGGWTAGSKEEEESFCLQFAQSGFTVFAIGYSLGPVAKLKQQINEVLLAVKYISEQKDYPFDKLFMSGSSAGGHLASLASALLTSTVARKAYEVESLPEIKISGVSLSCPCVELRDNFVTRWLSDMILGDFKSFEDYINISDCIADSYPPTITVVGARDRLTFKMSKRFNEYLISKGIVSKIIIAKKEGHVFNIKKLGKESSKSANQQIIDFFNIANP